LLVASFAALPLCCWIGPELKPAPGFRYVREKRFPFVPVTVLYEQHYKICDVHGVSLKNRSGSFFSSSNSNRPPASRLISTTGAHFSAGKQNQNHRNQNSKSSCEPRLPAPFPNGENSFGSLNSRLASVSSDCHKILADPISPRQGHRRQSGAAINSRAGKLRMSVSQALAIGPRAVSLPGPAESKYRFSLYPRTP